MQNYSQDHNIGLDYDEFYGNNELLLTSNDSESIDSRVPQEPQMVSTIVIASVLTSLVLVTIIGNMLVCLSVSLVRKLRKPQNYLLVSLAVSDLCVALFVMPFGMVHELEGKWPLGPGLCDLWVSGEFFWDTFWNNWVILWQFDGLGVKRAEIGKAVQCFNLHMVV